MFQLAPRPRMRFVNLEFCSLSNVFLRRRFPERLHTLSIGENDERKDFYWFCKGAVPR